MPDAVIAGAGEAPYRRHPPRGTTTESLLAGAARRALRNAGLTPSAIDGLAVASFSLAPDHAVDLAWKLGLRLRWLMEDTNGGAAGINMLQHAVRAVEAGDAAAVLVLAGDRLDRQAFSELVAGYNAATRDYLAPLCFGGPNALFALLTQRHMARHGLVREDYGELVIAQREWAGRNPGAVYREPLTLAGYLAAPLVAEPLSRYDCAPIVAGADALVVSSGGAGRPVAIRALKASYNPDQQEADGLRTGLAQAGDSLWEEAGTGPEDVDLALVYDDYPAIVLIQLEDLGFFGEGEAKRFVAQTVRQRRLPLNTSGGQLSAGQAGAAGGLHGLVEAVRQLRGEARDRQVDEARRALVTGYGMVLYQHGACANATVLERVR
ncbi:MAG: thiolase family protein [Actinobacteria bacterium]|nr:thiolase family protein [Actinomycetota bacterium]MDQ3161871.1 thiolase family protein [Actinomycetota bacterium]